VLPARILSEEETMTTIRLAALLIAIATTVPATADTTLPGLDRRATIARDANGVPHIFAASEHDLFFLQGWVHAEDRLFQMDFIRRQASGTLAELLGPDALASDVELRTLGLRRAAEASLAVLSEPVRRALAAYADGVNAFVARHPLPPEYGALELTAVAPWTPLDSATVGKALAFSLSFELDIEPTLTLLQYQGTGAAAGFDGTALYFEDLFRSAPFAPVVTVPDSGASMAAAAAARTAGETRQDASTVGLSPAGTALARKYLERIRGIDMLREAARPGQRSTGSNAWVVDGKHSATRWPILANDPHLALTLPATFHEVHLAARSLDVIGGSLPGAPFVAIGHNRTIVWGTTNNRLDVTDTFQEQVRPDPASPSGLSIVHNGALEPIIPIPQQFFANQVGNGVPDDLVPVDGPQIPPVVLIVPRRYNGPIIALDAAAGTALSVQFVGFGGTRELDSFYGLNRARNGEEFEDALRRLDVGSQNFVYADLHGDIAYLMAGALPLREDLEAGVVDGLPPFFIRNGAGGNEWLPAAPSPDQAVPYQLLPFEELPQVANPNSGVLLNANNDPAGVTLDNSPLNQLRPTGGIFYLAPSYQSLRAGRIAEMIAERLAAGRRLSAEDMQDMQADVVLFDAEVFVPYILAAFDNATAAGADPLLAALASDVRVVEAVSRLAAWDFTTPTGLAAGYDAADTPAGPDVEPAPDRVQASIAATIYSVWRTRFVANVIDRTLAPFSLPGPDGQQALGALRHLLDGFDIAHGTGASGLDFFAVPGVADAAARRDIVLLRSLAEALDLLASDAFAAAFANSTDQDHYRWGRLHRVVLAHVLNGPFSAPPAGGAFPPPLADLAGIPTDGGFETVDASEHPLRAATSDGFMFTDGPNRRFVAQVRRGRLDATTALPGGESGVIGSPHYVDLLPGWLTNEAFPLPTNRAAILHGATRKETFVPPRRPKSAGGA
jgi:penicillin amidase